MLLENYGNVYLKDWIVLRLKKKNVRVHIFEFFSFIKLTKIWYHVA